VNKQLLMSLCVLSIALSGCTTRHEPGPYVEIPAGSFAQAWRANLELGSDRIVSLHRVGDLVIAMTRRNTAYAMSAQGGTVKWISQIAEPGRGLGAPTLAGQRIVFPTADSLVVYSVLGRREKDIPLDRAIRSPLVGEGDFVYAGFDHFNQGRLGRISLVAPYMPVRWELMTRGAVSAAPAVFQDTVFSGSEDGNVYAVTDDRAPIWALPGNVFSTGAPITADLKVDDIAVYVASGDSKLYALDRQTGKILWQYFGGAPLRTSPLVTADTVYQFVPQQGIVAIDKLAGDYNRKPRFVVPGAVAALAQEGKLVYIRGGDNSVVAIDRSTGKPAFKTSRNDLAYFAANPTGGLVYAATVDGVVFGIRAVTTGGTVGQLVAAPDTGTQVGG